MGFGDVIGEGGQTSSSYQQYPDHEADDMLQEMFDYAQEHVFPEEIQCDFIEVSTRMEKVGSTTYHKVDGDKDTYFIRVSENAVDQLEDWHLYRMMKSSMLHIWCMQKGYGDISQNSAEFKWMRGIVGGMPSSADMRSDKWKELCEPFIAQEDSNWEREFEVIDDDSEGTVPPPEEDMM